MTWNTLYTTATPEEREEILLLLLKQVHKRRQRLVFAQGWLRRDRRQRTMHFIGDRRIRNQLRRRQIGLTAALTVMALLSWSTALFLESIESMFLITLANLTLISILLVKPHLRWQPAYQHA